MKKGWKWDNGKRTATLTKGRWRLIVYRQPENKWYAGSTSTPARIDVGPFNSPEEAIQFAEDPGFMTVMRIRWENSE